ncbi:glucose-1-dehydrogenase [Leuconostocaceae bacterium ESL0958]|nr:glucose-1-dehydrogenase [Leuconostocaceae bacterium ESL0958]
MFEDLNQKVAVITGGSKGIGNAIAIRYAQEKMKVVINYHSDQAGADKAVEQIKEAGGDAVAVQADVSTEAGVQALLDAAIDNFGGLDVWVNNAGMEIQRPTHEVSLEEWNKVIDINMTGVFLGEKAALNYWLDKKQPGAIINMSSVHQQIPWPTFASYATAKGGVKLLTETTAMEYAPHNIRVNALAPGAINTPINAKKFADKAQYEQTRSMVPMAKIGDPEDVADAAVWLASNQSKYVTGTTMFVDGGMSLYPSFQGGKG